MDFSTSRITIDTIVKENKIFRFASELECCNCPNRTKMLNSILKKLHSDSSDMSEKSKSQVETLCEKINLEALKKKWFKLTKEQKEEQIKKYYSQEENKDEEYQETIKLLNEDKLENKNVEYDEKNGKIINIKKQETKKKILKKNKNIEV